MKSFDYDGCSMVLCVLVLIAIVALAALQPLFESQAYNRLTGAQTTYWDALWLELRVQEAPKTQP